MIFLTFQFNREPLNFVVKGREIFYTQRKFAAGTWVRCLPPPENFQRIVALSRNRVPAFLIDMFKFTEDEIKEYSNAKDEDALAAIIVRDAKTRGCVHINTNKTENASQ